ncbi:hypothetical protein [Oligella sp. MSHR50489EDL]
MRERWVVIKQMRCKVTSMRHMLVKAEYQQLTIHLQQVGRNTQSL